jgi:hypothetical protein
MSIGHSLGEIMRDMTLQTTDHRHDQYTTVLFFVEAVKMQIFIQSHSASLTRFTKFCLLIIIIKENS